MAELIIEDRTTTAFMQLTAVEPGVGLEPTTYRLQGDPRLSLGTPASSSTDRQDLTARRRPLRTARFRTTIDSTTHATSCPMEVRSNAQAAPVSTT